MLSAFRYFFFSIASLSPKSGGMNLPLRGIPLILCLLLVSLSFLSCSCSYMLIIIFLLVFLWSVHLLIRFSLATLQKTRNDSCKIKKTKLQED